MENEKNEHEPLFKYLRITCDLNDILKSDSISSVAVTNRAFFIGTSWGKIFVLDHEGNNISHQTFSQHLLPINKISVDAKGEYVGTCSDDGKVCINCLYTEEKSVILNLEHQIKSIELDPSYSKTRRFIIGDTSLILYEKALLGRLKPTVLCDSEGFVTSIKWNGQFVAWSSSIGVRVYDIVNRCSIGLVKWDEPSTMKLSDLQCCFVWSKLTLFIGWADTIRTFTVAKRSSLESSANYQLPAFVLDPMSAFTTEFWICGLAPTENGHLVILGLPKKEDEDKNAQRPILSVIKLRGDVYEEMSNDSLALREFEQYSVNDYSLEYLADENRCFVISPKDMISASFYEVDDRVKYLIDRDQYSKALDVIREKGGKFTVVDVAKLYVDYLISHQSYEQAAKICFDIFENNKDLWEEEVYKFVKVRQLRAVGPYLPRAVENKLNPQVYEMVMYEYLKFDKVGFLTLVKEWQPTLYNATAVINAVHDHFEKKDKNVLLEALAILYSHEAEYDKAVKMYLKLQHKDVFNLIRSQNLYNVMQSMIVELMNLDSEKTIQLLIEKNKNSDAIVESLKSHENYLFAFLDAFERADSSGKFDWRLIQLCVKYNREKLLPLLKRSKTYALQEAFDMCKSNFLHREMIYLLDRMGNAIDALEIIINELRDTKMAIDFCREHDDIELWEYLIDKSINKSEIVTLLMDSMSSFFINPEILINKIEIDQEIFGLKNALITMLHNYDTQVGIHSGCNSILKTDYFSVYEKLIKQQERGAFISSQSNCASCQRQIFSNQSQTSNFILFKCKHLFHESCHPTGEEDSMNDFCSICTSNRSWNN